MNSADDFNYCPWRDGPAVISKSYVTSKAFHDVSTTARAVVFRYVRVLAIIENPAVGRYALVSI